MKRIAVVTALFLCAGCVGALDEQVLKLRSELNAERKQAEEGLRADYTRELAAAKEALRADYTQKLQELKAELNGHKDVHQKDLKEVNLTLIDVQKDFFQNRRVTEENARRVYILESLIAATRPASEERAEGEILYFKDGNVTTSLGTRHGIKAGDLLAVFKDEASKEKVATVRVVVAETTESKGEVVDKTTAVSRGNFVKPMK